MEARAGVVRTSRVGPLVPEPDRESQGRTDESRTVSPGAGQTTQAGTAATAGRCIQVVDIPHLQLLTAELPFQGVICSVNVESALPGFS